MNAILQSWIQTDTDTDFTTPPVSSPEPTDAINANSTLDALVREIKQIKNLQEQSLHRRHC